MKSVLFPNAFFFLFIYSVLMVKLNSINQKACLIEFYSFIFTKWCFPLFHYRDSILMVPLHFNNQKHLQLIDKKIYIL